MPSASRSSAGQLRQRRRGRKILTGARHSFALARERTGRLETDIVVAMTFLWPTSGGSGSICSAVSSAPRRATSRPRTDGSAASSHDGVGVMLYTPDGNLCPLEEIEADVIRLAIGHYRGRMTEVARRLGIGRSTLYRKLSDLGIDNAA